MYIPHTAEEQKEMLKKIGIDNLDQLFDAIPEGLRFKGDLKIPQVLSEIELTQHLSALGRKNDSCDRCISFLGAGCYDHFVPAVVDVIGSRSEYYTAYTPYQAEASQGTLQVGFEFQTLMCQLTGLEASNASLYEAASSCAEAVLMAQNVTGRKGKIIVSGTVHPEYRQTITTYLANLETDIVTIPPTKDGLTDLEALSKAIDDTTSCVLVQSPNIFGIVEPVGKIVAAAEPAGAMVVQSFDPISLGMLKRPGDYGVDIAVAEGQSLGTPMSFGGPFLGIFTCREKYVRKIPGRIIGETLDRRGNKCYVLTLQTREQHIRRDKATSNICTNQALFALRASVYLALVGPQGLKEVAELCWQKAHYAADELAKLPGVKLKFAGKFFKEFVIELPKPAETYLEPLVKAGYHGGIALGRWFPELANCMLVAVTEKRTKADIDGLVKAWRELL